MANVVETVFRGVDEISNNVAQMNSSLSKMGVTVSGVASAFRQLLAIGGIVQLGRQFVSASDAMQEMNETIAQFRDTQEDVLRTQQSLARISIATDTAYRNTFELYARLGLESEKLGLSERDRLQVVEAINQAQQLAGPLARDVGAAFQRILTTGEVSGQTLLRTLGGAPRLLKAIADEFGVTTSQLKELAEKGKLTANSVLEAVANQSEEIRRDFEKTGQTVGESLTNVGTAFGQLFTKIDNQLGGTGEGASFLQNFAEILADLAKEETQLDVVKNALTASSDKLNEAMEAQRVLRLATNEIVREMAAGDNTNADVLSTMIVELERATLFMPALRAEVDQLQALFNKLSEEAEAADGALRGGAAGVDVYAGKVGEMIKKLEEMAAVTGMTEDETILYQLAQEGVSEAHIRAARTALEEVEALEGVTEAQVRAARVTLETKEAQLAAARSALAAKDAYDRLQESMSHMKDHVSAFVPSFEGEEGPFKEIEIGLEEMTNMSAEALAQLRGKAVDTASDVSIAWDQAVRNIQSIMADNLFNAFDDGIKGMLRSFLDMIRRMIAEALAANLIEKMFGGDTSQSGASGFFAKILGSITGGGKGGGKGGGSVRGGAPLAGGGWTTPGAVHPINEVEPEFLVTAGRDRVVPLSKMAAHGMGAGGGAVFAPVTHLSVTAVMSPGEMEMTMRRRDDALLAKFKMMQFDGEMT
jgi:tape measure domain-containing protein